jgi:hypothetical protein
LAAARQRGGAASVGDPPRRRPQGVGSLDVDMRCKERPPRANQGGVLRCVG